MILKMVFSIKLTNLKFPENDNLDLFLKIWGLEIGKGD